jgi:hypothetical protein
MTKASPLSSDPLTTARRVVIKVGSSLLIDQETGKPHEARFSALAADAARLRSEGKAIVIVSSGAVALGRRALGLKSGKLRLEEKQAAAAAGQPRLMRAWEDALAQHGAPVAQALLTFYDTEQRRRWLNARATLEALIERGAIPGRDEWATKKRRLGTTGAERPNRSITQQIDVPNHQGTGREVVFSLLGHLQLGPREIVALAADFDGEHGSAVDELHAGLLAGVERCVWAERTPPRQIHDETDVVGICPAAAVALLVG